MNIDWQQFERDVQQQVQVASQETDQQLASQIASQIRLTQTEVQAMFPRREDLQAFARLMSIVKASTNRHQKIQRIADESQALGGVIVQLLNKLV